MKQLITNKLFYNKWPYKIACQLFGSNLIIRFGPKKFKYWVQNPTRLDYFTYEKYDLLQIESFFNKIYPFMGKDIKIRTEGSNFNIFCCDLKIFNQLQNDLSQWIIAVYSPENDQSLEFMLKNHKKRICDQLPKNRYNYKVFLKKSFPRDQREQFLSWSQRYNEKILIFGVTLYWMSGNQHYTQGPFMYVEDSPTLSLVCLFLGSHIKNIEEFVPKSKLNNSLDQEIICQP